MPAIKLNELKNRSKHLADFHDQPASFIRALHQILDDYSERSHRSGQTGTPTPLISSYHVPLPVIRQLQRSLIPLLNENLEIGLELVDALWDEPYFEFRLMAAQLLGQLPTHHPERIVERVRMWSQKEADNQLLNSLLHDALAGIQSQHKDVLLVQIKSWLSSEDLFRQQLGLRSLNLLLADTEFEDIPYLLRLLTPYLRSSPGKLYPEIINTIRALAKRTPMEAAYFLRQNLEAPDNPSTAFLVRRSLPAFPPDLQENLRSAIRGMD